MRLKPGTYRVKLIATNPAGKAKAKAVRLRVLPALARLTAEITAFSDAVTMLASMPDAPQHLVADLALDVRRRDRVAARRQGVLGVVEHADVVRRCGSR